MFSIRPQIRYLLVFFSAIILILMFSQTNESNMQSTNFNIVFISKIHDHEIEENNYAINRIRDDGTGYQEILNSDSRIVAVDCHLESQTLVFSEGSEYSPIFRVDFDGTDLKPEFDTETSVQALSFSPDGQHIVYSEMSIFYSIELEFEEWITILNRPSQTDQTLQSDFWFAYRSPQWSPTDNLIVYSYHPKDGWGTEPHGIAVINANGSYGRHILETKHWVGDPAWSPDGSHIVFSMQQADSKNLFIMQSDGSGLTQLTDSSGDDILPRWSPGGQTISFSSNRNRQTYQIYTIDVEGNNLRQITQNQGDNYNQCWIQN